MKTVVEDWVVRWNDYLQKWVIVVAEPWLYSAPSGHPDYRIDGGGFDNQSEAVLLCDKVNRQRQRKAKLARCFCLVMQFFGLWRRYQVNGSGYASGRFWHFAYLRNARKRFDLEKESWRHVRLEDKLYEETLLLQEDNVTFPIPIIHLDEDGTQRWQQDYAAIDTNMGSHK